MANRGRPRHPDILTPREWEVLELLRSGASNAQIAERLSITERTVKFHVSEILSKLGVGSREEAARIALPELRRWRQPQPGSRCSPGASCALAARRMRNNRRPRRSKASFSPQRRTRCPGP